MASKSTNASDRTQKASKSKRKSSRRMKKSTNTPDTTQKASKSKKKDVRYQSLGTVPIFGEMNNKRSMREPKRRDVLETPIPDNSRSSRRSVRTSRTKSRTKSTDNAFVWELSAEEEDDDISSPRHKSSPPLSRKRRTCDDENTSPGRVQPPKKRHKSNGSLRSSRTHSHSISTPAQSITAQQERFDQHTYCHYDVDQHVREEILQLGSKKNVNGLVRSLNEILVANNNKLHELNEGLKAENRELRQQNINREKYESKAEEALNHLQREYEHVRGLLYYTRRRVKYVSQRREKEKKRLLPQKTKEGGRTAIYYRADQAIFKLDDVFNEFERKQMQRKELLQDLYGVLAEKRDEFAKQFAKETNREFDALKADYARVFSIAITEHALSLTQRQARDARIANTKVMGAHGRSINRLTETGVKFGGGVLTDYQKNMVTRIYEYERQEKEIHFMPIPYDTLRIDQDYKRFYLVF